MNKRRAYELALMYLDTGGCSPAGFVDWLYDNDYVIVSAASGDEAYQQQLVEKYFTSRRTAQKEAEDGME